MIVSCPSCQTRYRHEAEIAAAEAARCSRCDTCFPVEAVRRSYVLLPGSFGRRMAVGMDDPSLATQVAASGIESGDGAAALSYAVTGQEATQTTSEHPRTPFFDSLVAIAPTAAGAAVAYYAVGGQGANGMTWTALGAAIGLLFGWGCLLWIRPRG